MIIINADGKHGFFPCWTWSNAVSYNSSVLSLDDSGISCICCEMHPKQEPFMDWNIKAPHRLLWRSAKVIFFPFQLLLVYDSDILVFVYFSSWVFLVLLTGIAPSCWLNFILLLWKVSSRQCTRNSPVWIVVLWLFLRQPKVFYLKNLSTCVFCSCPIY